MYDEKKIEKKNLVLRLNQVSWRVFWRRKIKVRMRRSRD
jgi:hypothetical protein